MLGCSHILVTYLLCSKNKKKSVRWEKSVRAQMINRDIFFKWSKGGFPLRRTRPRDQAMGYEGMRSSKPEQKASVYWRTRGHFWKLNQVQLFRDQNERKPIRLLLFNARACDRTGSRDQIR